MMSIDTLLIFILIGAFVLMAGILFFKEPRKNQHNTLVECAFWGLGFFLSMSVQVMFLASMN